MNGMEVVFDFLARFDGLIAIFRGLRKAKTPQIAIIRTSRAKKSNRVQVTGNT